MYCRNCGQKLPDGAKFCPICGTDVPDMETLLAAARSTQAHAQQAAGTAGETPSAGTDEQAAEPQNGQAARQELQQNFEKYMQATFGQAAQSDTGEYAGEPADSGTETVSDIPEIQQITDSDETMVLPDSFVQQYGQAAVYNADMPQGRKNQEQTISSARAYIPDEPDEPAYGHHAGMPQNAENSGLSKGVWIAIIIAAALILIVLSAFITVKILDSGTEDELSITQEAQSAYNEGNYEEAVSILEGWLDTADSATSTVYRLLARSYIGLNELDTAAQIYAMGYEETGQQALADSAAEVWLILAEQSSNPDYYYGLILELDPDNAEALAAISDDSEIIEDASEESDSDADTDTGTDAESESDSGLSDSEQAQAFYDAGDYNGAEVLLYTMKRSGSLTASDYALYGLVLQAQDRSDSAVTTYYEGYTETGDTSLLEAGTALALELAEASIEKGDYEVAQIWYETILEYDASSAAAAEGLETVDALLNPAEPVYETRYTAVTGSYTWEEARQEAESRGGQLAVITDLEAYNAIVEQLNDTLLTAVWVGGRTGTPGDWSEGIWTDGSSITYTRWYTGQADGDSSYLSLVLEDGSWYYSAAADDLSELAEVTGFVMEIQAEVSE